ncbi:hypothetical protein ASPZODRAFT_15500 [Penicilliopsis zonata CBS 506.65]|uniref:Nephrocystin 3-like N-terminal domain-containing protein n=1 Tax=Penicilliopsis zonata CBS 506.65 TaxID=1073090 RepID=A0A1L9SLI0_9EURO|nr:hypothetical protein ASPZODRAFT_15500 [Penicilliopsis zonata CBS 506.65]OJJ48055.1 hypothetical protein ASPZODRAFT_15500 [Penicilliopsis zonata CBS 506.65]
MANVVEHLQSARLPRFVLSYFDPGKSLSSADNDSILSQIIRSLIWQYSNVHPPIARSMVEIINRTKFVTSLDLWKNLVVENETRKMSNHTLYILIDDSFLAEGSDPLLPLLHSAQGPEKSHKIKFLITSTPRRQQRLLEAGMKIKAINIALHSQVDIETYVKAHLSRMESLADTSNSIVMSYRNRIVTELCVKSRGNWTTVSNILDLIRRQSRSPGAIDGILRVLDKQASTSSLILRQLERDLSDDEVLEVDTVITWITAGLRPLTPEEINTVVLISRGNRWFDDFSSRMKRYPIFDTNQVGEVGWRSPDIEALLPIHQFRSTAQKDVDPVLDTEINIITHSLRNICPEPLFEKYEFGRFLEEKRRHGPRAQHQPRIYIDKVNGNPHIALVCLQALINGSETSSLVYYAGQYLLQHLARTDLDHVDPALKSQVKRLLAELFISETAMMTFFCISRDIANDAVWSNGHGIGQRRWLEAIRKEWLYSDLGCTELSRWFKDGPPATPGLSESALKIITAFANGQANRYDLLYDTALKLISLDTVRMGNFNLPVRSTTICFLVGLQARNSGKHIENDDLVDLNDVSLDDLLRVERRMLEVYQDTYSTFIPFFNVFMSTLFFFFGEKAQDRSEEAKRSFADASRERLHRAQDAAPTDDIRIMVSMAIVENSPEMSIPLMEGYVEMIENEGVEGIEKTKLMIYCSSLMGLAREYWKQAPDKREKARHFYQRGVRMGLYGTKSYLSTMVMQYIDDKDWPGIIAIFDIVNSSHKTWERGTMPWFIRPLIAPGTHLAMIQAAIQSGNMASIFSIHDTLLQLAEEEQDTDAVFGLRRTYGLILHGIGSSLNTERYSERAIGMLERALGGPVPVQRGLYQVSGEDVGIVISTLAELYFQQHVNNNKDRVWSDKLERLVEDHDTTKNPPAARCLAAYYMRHRQISKAREAVQELVRMGLEMLSDHDPSNDRLAFQLLFTAMSPLDESERVASIAKVQCLIAREKWTAAGSTTSHIASDATCNEENNRAEGPKIEIAPQPSSHGHVDYICHKCQGPGCISSGMWMATNGVKDIFWDAVCYKKLQQIPSALKSWEEWRFTEVTKMEMDELPNTLIPVGSQTILLKEWKKRLREAYCSGTEVMDASPNT